MRCSVSVLFSDSNFLIIECFTKIFTNYILSYVLVNVFI